MIYTATTDTPSWHRAYLYKYGTALALSCWESFFTLLQQFMEDLLKLKQDLNVDGHGYEKIRKCSNVWVLREEGKMKLSESIMMKITPATCCHDFLHIFNLELRARKLTYTKQ